MQNIKIRLQLHQEWLNNNGGKQLDIENEEFSNITLKDENLNTSIFYNTKFESSIFRNLNLGGSSFFNCTFSAVNFEKSFLRKCEFHQCKFINCNFSEDEITKAEFYDTSMEFCTFNKIKFGWSYFGNCFISDTTFSLIELDSLACIDSKFINVDFEEAQFNIEYPVKINDQLNIIDIDQLKIAIED